MYSLRPPGVGEFGMSNEPNESVRNGVGDNGTAETPNAEAARREPGADAGQAQAASTIGDAVPGGALVTPEELAALRDKASQADALRDRCLRAVADLDNLRKRAARERQEAVQYANQALLEKLVPALDNLDMALTAVASAQGNSLESLKRGVEMVLAQLKTTLKEAGLEEIHAEGQPFDPTWHEAVAEHETTEAPEGHVVQQLRKGYRLNQRLLRPANVVVARLPQG